MTGPGGFSISPATSAGPASVTLVMPAHGYVARAFLTNPCGQVLPAPASVTVRGMVATPHHLPHGTSYLDWQIAPAVPAATGGRVSMVLASKQTIGHATTCTSGPSPYGHKPDPRPADPHQQTAAAVMVAHQSAWTEVTGIGGYVLLAVALMVTGCWLWWRRRHHPKGAHR